MTDNLSVIDIGELSKPATVLIEKISDAIGGVFRPGQIRRIAQAEVEAEKIKAISQIEIDELRWHALNRFLTEEAKKQNNIEKITAKAISQINTEAQPQNMEDDWITNFFDKCRLISDEEMQTFWSKVLAGEANSPGKHSKRTVNFLGSLDKYDAYLFQSLCCFTWTVGEDGITPLIYDATADIYSSHNVNFNTVKHLDEIGLISFEPTEGYASVNLPKKIQLSYFDKIIEIEFKKENGNILDIGKVLLSKVGQELSPICGAQPIPEFYSYVIENLEKERILNISSPIKPTSLPNPKQ